MRQILILGIYFLLSGGLSATEITVSRRDTTCPLVNVWLTNSSAHESVHLKPQQNWIDLELERSLVDHQDFRYVWKRDGKTWMTEALHLWSETSHKAYWLEGGKDWKLEIQTAEGKVLARLDFKRGS